MPNLEILLTQAPSPTMLDTGRALMALASEIEVAKAEKDDIGDIQRDGLDDLITDFIHDRRTAIDLIFTGMTRAAAKELSPDDIDDQLSSLINTGNKSAVPANVQLAGAMAFHQLEDAATQHATGKSATGGEKPYNPDNFSKSLIPIIKLHVNNEIDLTEALFLAMGNEFMNPGWLFSSRS